MVMSPTNGTDSLIQRMKARVYAGLTPEIRHLIAAMREQAQQAAVHMLDPLPTPDVPPEEFVEILRLPEGNKHHLSVTIDGQDIQLVLNSSGATNPPREAELWTWLLQRVREDAP